MTETLAQIPIDPIKMHILCSVKLFIVLLWFQVDIMEVAKKNHDKCTTKIEKFPKRMPLFFVLIVNIVNIVKLNCYRCRFVMRIKKKKKKEASLTLALYRWFDGKFIELSIDLFDGTSFDMIYSILMNTHITTNKQTSI